MQSEQEKYYAEKNRQVQAVKDKESNAMLLYMGIGLALLIAIYIVFLFVFAPGVLVAYIAFKFKSPQMSAGALWFISIGISCLVYSGIYFSVGRNFEKSAKSYFIICGALSVIVLGLYVFKYKPIMDLPEAFWPFRNGPIEVASSQEETKTLPIQYEIKTTASVEAEKKAMEEKVSQDNEKSKLESDEISEKLLLGKWKHVSLEKKVDGQSTPIQLADGESFSEFFQDGSWILRTQNYVSAGKFKWLDGQRIEQTILESPLAIQVGMVSVKRIRVTENRLEIITVQTAADLDKLIPAKAGTKHPNETVITSVFSRVM